MREKLKIWWLYLTVFITGAAVLVIEILGTRVLAPFYGSTIFVWSSLISVTLGALALGYWAGGKLADNKPYPYWLYSIISFAGAIIFVLLQYKKFIILFADSFGLKYGPLVASTFLFSLPLFLLGMVGPFAIRLLVQAVDFSGRKSGAVFGFSTLGSLMGALASGFILIPLLSLTLIFTGISGILFLVGMGGFFVFGNFVFFKGKLIKILILILISSSFAYILKNLEIPKMTRASHGVYVTETIYEDNNFYGNYRLVGVPRKIDGVWCLLIDGSNQGCVLPEERSVDYNTGSPYGVIAFLFEQLEPNSDVLVLGAGAGEFFRYWAPDYLNYTVVDINPSAYKIWEEAGINIHSSNYKLVIDDARSYLEKADRNYDAIWNDLFGNASPVANLMTKEALTLIKEKLKPEGVYITNVFGQTTGEDELVNSVLVTLKSIFKNVIAAPRNREHFFTYIVAVASDKVLGAEEFSAAYHARRNKEVDVWGPQNYYFFEPNLSGITITDEYNPAEFLWAKNVAENETLQSFRSNFKRLSADDFK